MKLTPKLASRLAVALTIALLPSVTYPGTSSEQSVRVQITRLGQPARVTITASVGALSISTAESRFTAPGLELRAEASRVMAALTGSSQAIPADWIKIETCVTSSHLRIECSDRSPLLVRDVLEAECSGGTLTLVNEVGLENYVAGVLPAEMPESYPLESLKAQAVAIRTYALRNRGKHKAAGCDVCDSTHCQCYTGLVDGKPRCFRAVQETAGLILLYGDGPAHVFYSADGGGSTQDYAGTHPGCNAPYLCGVRDPEGVPHISWEKTYTLSELSNRLVRAGIKNAAGLKTIRIGEIAPTGRVQTLELAGSRGTARIYANALRTALGLEEIKSTLFTLETLDQSVVIKGRGYGHGIGMCQTGSKGLAQQPFGYSWERILAHYFPGTKIGLASTPRVALAPYTETKTIAARGKNPAPTTTQPAKKTTRVKPTSSKPMFDVRLIEPDLL